MMGFRNRDTWFQDFEDAKRSADETMELLHERTQVLEAGGTDAARLTGTIRRYDTINVYRVVSIVGGSRYTRVCSQGAKWWHRSVGSNAPGILVRRKLGGLKSKLENLDGDLKNQNV